MKKKLVVGVLIFTLQSYVQASWSDTTWSDAARSLVGTYFFGSSYLINKTDALRLAVKSAYNTAYYSNLGESYDDLCARYALPPVGAVPSHISTQLELFRQTPIASIGKNFSEQHFLRKGSELGTFEQDFIKARLAYARKFFSPSDEPFKNIPDAQQLPYGYKLQTGLAEDKEVPRIAVCLSGGGFRAMIASLGFWQAMADTGMTGSVLYDANLSGSTWCSIPWSIGATLEELKATYKKYAKVRLDTHLVSDIKNYIMPNIKQHHLINKVTSAFLWDQPLSSIRVLYGPLIGQMTLSFWEDSQSDERRQSSQYLYFWQALEYIKDGTQRPFPIATALLPFESKTTSKMQALAKQPFSDNGLWMEFNPESVGFEYFHEQKLTGAWVPSFALGRQFTTVLKEPKRWYRIFQNDKTIGWESEAGPVQTVDYWAGTWGSAFTVAPKDLYRIFYSGNASKNDSESFLTKSVDTILSYFQTAADSTIIGGMALNTVKDARLYPAEFNNFALFDDSPFNKKSTIIAVDAGIDFNLPFPPLLRSERKIDVIIVGDWSKQQTDIPAKELVLAEAWAKNRRVPFPIIKNSEAYKTVGTVPMTLFNEFEEGQSGPAILYIPLIDNQFNASDFSVSTCFDGACSTFNFDYTPHYVEKLSEHVQNTVHGVYPQICEFIQDLVRVKNGEKATMIQSLKPLDQLVQS